MIKKILKSRLFVFCLGLLISGITLVYAVNISSNDVFYDNSNSGSSATTVSDAIDDLYSRVGHASDGESLNEITRIHVRVTQSKVTSYQPQTTVQLFNEEDVLIDSKSATTGYQASVNESATAVSYVVGNNTIKVTASGYYGSSGSTPINYIHIYLNDEVLSTLYAPNTFDWNGAYPTVTDYYLGIMDNKIALYNGSFTGSSSNDELEFFAIRTKITKVTSYQPQTTIQIFDRRGRVVASGSATTGYQASVVEDNTATTYSIADDTFKVTASGYYGGEGSTPINHVQLYLNDSRLAIIYLPNTFDWNGVYSTTFTYYVGICENKIIIYSTDTI